jgi:hypothetical protein
MESMLTRLTHLLGHLLTTSVRLVLLSPLSIHDLSDPVLCDVIQHYY